MPTFTAPSSLSSAEAELAIHLKKAITPSMTAPKYKHVRACILFTWDTGTSVPFWQAIKLQPVFGDEIQCWKALQVIHRVLLGGPHVILGEAMNERAYLDNISRMSGGVSGTTSTTIYSDRNTRTSVSYRDLIRLYVQYLMYKLEFHSTHPLFTGNFDYEEFMAQKTVDDLNEGYHMVQDLQELLDRLEPFYRTLLGACGHSECRMSALIPVIEESHALYKFITSLLSALHSVVDSKDPLVLLDTRFEGQFWSLKSFYDDCRKMNYLTNLTDIPKLTSPPFRGPEPDPVEFIVEDKTKPSQALVPQEPKPSTPMQSSDEDTQQHVEIYQETTTSRYPTLATAAPMVGVYQGTPGYAMVQQQPQQQPMYPYQPPQQQQEVIVLQQEVERLTQTLEATLEDTDQYKTRIAELEEALEETEDKLNSSHGELMTLKVAMECDLKTAKEQASQFKSKYDSLVKTYHEVLQETKRLKEQLSEFDQGQEEQIKELKEALLNSQEQIECLEAQLKEKEVMIQQLQAENLKLSHELEEVQDEAKTKSIELEDEMARIARAIAEAAESFAKQGSMLLDLDSTHSSIRDLVKQILEALGTLIHHATMVQAEIVKHGAGKAGLSNKEFYLKNSEWTEGLISAARAVAQATLVLIDHANQVLLNKKQGKEGNDKVLLLDQLAVASSGVSSTVARLVTASRVKADPESAQLYSLEQSAGVVTSHTRALTLLASSGSDKQNVQLSETDRQTLLQDPHQAKVKEMDQQVLIKSLERQVEIERARLGEMRKLIYQQSQSLEDETEEKLKFKD